MIFSSFDRRDYLFLKMKIKGSVAGSIGAVFQKPDGFAGRGDFPSIPITTEWEEVTVFTNCTGDAATRILFNYGKYAGTIYIDDLSIYWQKSGNTIPLTPEEKEEILTNELERWIKGMLESCGGYVKAWDVVNEPISGKIRMGMAITIFSQLLKQMIMVFPVKTSIGRIIWVMITPVFRLSLRVSICGVRW